MQTHRKFFLPFLALMLSSAHAQTTPPKADSAAKPATPKASASAMPAVGKRTAVAADRLDLDTTVVTGNRELPKVLYIVPWKKSEIGELPAQPFNTLLDEVLAPVDRDVFKREVKYFHAVNAESKPAAAGGAPAAKN
jgi:hypothetical protein